MSVAGCGAVAGSVGDCSVSDGLVSVGEAACDGGEDVEWAALV